MALKVILKNYQVQIRPLLDGNFKISFKVDLFSVKILKRFENSH